MYEHQNERLEIVPVTLTGLLAMKLPPRANILEPWLPQSGLTMIYAQRGVGKTHVALEIMMAVAYGGSFLGFHASRPRKVVYIDGEMPGKTMQERLQAIKERLTSCLNMIEPTIITPDLQSGSMPNLSTVEGQQAIAEIIEDADLVIVDNISTLCDSGSNENDADSWRAMQRWALGLRQKGKSVLFIHHAGKSGNQRGTSKREDILDTVISLKHPADYVPSMGATFELHFEKARGNIGDDVKPLRCELSDDGWKFTPLDEGNYTEVVELYKEGFKQCQIVKELNISKGQVSKIVTKAKENGDIKLESQF